MQILSNKYKSPQFGKMSPEDVDLWADALLLKINSITGWVIPTGPALVVLSDQLKKKLTESYANVNPDEVEYAFRNHGTEVKDWGKRMNLALIDNIMGPYLMKRYDISLTEEQMTESVLQIEYKEDMSDEAMTDWFEAKKKDVRSGACTIDFIPIMLYEWLDGKGEIKKTGSEKKEYLARAVEHRQGQLFKNVSDKDNFDNRKVFSSFMLMKEEGCFQGDEIDKLKTLAKKLIVYDLIKSL